MKSKKDPINHRLIEEDLSRQSSINRICFQVILALGAAYSVRALYWVLRVFGHVEPTEHWLSSPYFIGGCAGLISWLLFPHLWPRLKRKTTCLTWASSLSLGCFFSKLIAQVADFAYYKIVLTLFAMINPITARRYSGQTYGLIFLIKFCLACCSFIGAVFLSRTLVDRQIRLNRLERTDQLTQPQPENKSQDPGKD